MRRCVWRDPVRPVDDPLPNDWESDPGLVTDGRRLFATACRVLPWERGASAVGQRRGDAGQDAAKCQGRREDQGPEGEVSLGHARAPFMGQ